MNDAHDVSNIFHLVYNDKKSGGDGVDGSGGPHHDSEMERRVTALEAKVDGIKDTLNAMQVTLVKIEASIATKDDISKLDIRLNTIEHTMATSASLAASDMRTAVLEERTAKLLTTRSAGVMVALAIGALTLVTKWHDIVSILHK
ncbi:hypothetical protein [Novacetimonas hansenii]|uniref:hypothetical protein n=1 Tax=Novacetimonas hansenii TaxID=436 RepID=UPI000A956BC7|nr:hypothetical protein [Novacetimonas hansenii]